MAVIAAARMLSAGLVSQIRTAERRGIHEESHHAERFELPLLKLQKRDLATLTDEQMTALLAREPKGFVACPLHAVIAFVLDTGVRIDEPLTVRVSNVDCDRYRCVVLTWECPRGS